MKLKENSSAQKLRGGYYTPKELADFIVKNINNAENMSILEPSCGDGVFIDSISELLPDTAISKVDAVEIEEVEAKKVVNKNYGSKYNIINSDFLEFYHKNKTARYDLILGNPPYIRYQYLTKEQREIQSEILLGNQMQSNKLINSWVCFLVACVELLSENGSIGFVIPAELLQVAYAEDLRLYLSNSLSKITLLTFKELVFPDIEQEVVVLIGEKDTSIAMDRAVISVIELENLKDMASCDLSTIEYQEIEHTKEKWTHYFLSKDENAVVKKYRNHNSFSTFDDIAVVNVGITTGNNKFFSLDKQTVSDYELDNVTLPLIGRSSHAHGLFFNLDDWKSNVGKDARAHLLYFPVSIPFDEYPDLHKAYITKGEKDDEHKGYKCSIRDRWYIVPSVWVPDAFFLRRNNVFPKFVLNEINAVSTDTMHRIKFNEGIDRRKALLSYYNSITFAFTEINGRSYGGGVLEILPREVGSVILPNIQDLPDEVVNDLLEFVDESIRNKRDVDLMLDRVDRIILVEHLGLSYDEVSMFRGIWKKLMGRRLGRS